jgi:hypothetical protein
MTVKQVFNTSAELDFPNVLPTLDLDFANSKTLDTRITFTRASGGSYIGADGLIKYAGVNEPRFDHDPVTGESLGLLIEESRQNFISQSDTFSGWPVLDIIPSLDNSIINPTGNGGVRKIIENVGNVNNQKVIFFDATVGNNNQFFSHSFFVKPIGNRNVQLNVHNIGSPDAGFSIHYDIKNKNFFNINTTQGCILSSYGAIEYPNGWYKIYATANTTSNNSSGTQLRFHIRIVDDTINKTPVYNGDGVSGLYIWGAQLEQGAFPTSYIPTTTSARTRAADNASITGKNFSDFYRRDEGSFFSSFRINALNLNDFPGVFYVDDGTISNSIGVYVNDKVNDKIGSEAYALGIIQYQLFSNSAVIPNMINKVCNSYKINNFYTSFSDRNSILSDNLGSIPTVNILRIGSLRGNRTKLGGTISRLTYYPRALQPSQLQSLTS